MDHDDEEERKPPGRKSGSKRKTDDETNKEGSLSEDARALEARRAYNRQCAARGKVLFATMSVAGRLNHSYLVLFSHSHTLLVV